MMHRHVTHLLTAYLHGELPPHLRSRVIRHLEVCDTCYAAMLHEREMVRTLESQMPVFGMPYPETLSRLLPGILAEVRASSQAAVRPQGLPGAALALVMSLVLALVVPVLMAPHTAAVQAPDQPAPYMVAATATQSVTDSPVLVLASPTAVAQRLGVVTEPAELAPAPAPIALMTPGPR